MKAPDPPPDTAAIAAQRKALDDQTVALQDKLQGDTASIMARYGALLSMTGTSVGATGSK